MTETHLTAYLGEIGGPATPLGVAVAKHTEDFVSEHVRQFSHMARIKGLLFGEVQSGKTAHMFGVIAGTADADPGFSTFVLLTTNNRNLQQQTIRRAFRQLPTFNVCDETDDVRFIHAGFDRPSLVILKKDPNVLKTWNAHFSGAARLTQGPLFILDDEADNASPNARVNQSDISRTFELVQTMRQRGTSSIYLQVTATPQSLLLQSLDSDTRPEFLHYFEPGPGYLGGSFFFTKPSSFIQRTVPESEKADLLDRGVTSSIGLRNAIASFLVTCAQMSDAGETNVNFLVHPSVSRGDHSVAANKITAYLELARQGELSREDELIFYSAHQDLLNSFPGLISFERVKDFLFSEKRVNVFLLNSSEEAERENTFEEGFNIIVGGNTLGRGVTFSRLQTVYYVRSSKTPQADTFWQHSRMFGYDRIPELIRVFMPPSAFRTFRVLHEANENLVAQLRTGKPESVQILLAPGFRPTRSNVLDRRGYTTLVGGTNYFPSDPSEANWANVETLVGGFDDSVNGHLVAPELIQAALRATSAKATASWPEQGFVEAVDAVTKSLSPSRCRLVMRRGRNIAKDTGTLLSPDDRALSQSLADEVVLMLYEIAGKREKGWGGSPFWIPNFKLPTGLVFHRGG